MAATTTSRNRTSRCCLEWACVLVRVCVASAGSACCPCWSPRPLLILTADAPAFACFCVGYSLQKSLDHADVVFTGEVLRRDAPRDSIFSAAKPTYLVRVDRVFKCEMRLTQPPAHPRCQG